MSRMTLLGVSALASLSALALGAPAAWGTHPDDTMSTVSCVLGANSVSGQAETGTEDGVNSFAFDGAPPGVPVGGGWDPLQLMDTDPGHFNFSGPAKCQGEDLASEVDTKNAPESFDDVDVTITASGDFDNLVCSTGTANGDAVLRSAAGEPVDLQIYAEFGIHFDAGVGELAFVVDADEADETSAGAGGQIPTRPDGRDDIAAGALLQGERWAGSDMAAQGYPGHSFVRDNQIDGGMGTGEIDITPKTGNCENTNVTEFFVNGEFNGFLSGEGSTVTDPNPGTPGVTHDSDG